MIDVPNDWSGDHVITNEHCERCGFTSRRGKYFWSDCPRCVPQATPLGELVLDPGANLGPEWVWIYNRGLWGCWCPASEYAIIDRDSYHEGMRTLAAYLVDSDVGFTLPELIRRVLARLGDGRPSPADVPKMSALADRAAEADRELRAKRVQCDALKDRVAELEEALESIVKHHGHEFGPAVLAHLRRMIRK